jgi:gliding motility-associated-like protein
VEVQVTIGLSGLIIPNTFTPNNDGVNDLWVIKNIENYPGALVQIFNRYGQRVFESKGYSQPFDGKYGGSLLPPGVYYYIINLNSNCSLLSGSLTLIR